MTNQFQKRLHSGTLDPADLTDADHRAMLALIHSSLIDRERERERERERRRGRTYSGNRLKRCSNSSSLEYSVRAVLTVEAASATSR